MKEKHVEVIWITVQMRLCFVSRLSYLDIVIVSFMIITVWLMLWRNMCCCRHVLYAFRAFSIQPVKNTTWKVFLERTSYSSNTTQHFWQTGLFFHQPTWSSRVPRNPLGKPLGLAGLKFLLVECPPWHPINNAV